MLTPFPLPFNTSAFGSIALFADSPHSRSPACLPPSRIMADDRQFKLIDFLTIEAGCTKEIANFITQPAKAGGLSIASVSDFASYLTEAKYEEDVDTDIIAKTSMRDNRLALGRLRSAWRLARAEFPAAVKKGADGDVTEDIESPLDQSIVRSQNKGPNSVYHFRFPDDESAADSLFARLYCEFKNQNITVHPLVKSRIASMNPILENIKGRKIAPDVNLRTGASQELPETNFDSVLLVMWALHTLTNTWARVGLTQEDSKLKNGKKVCDYELTDSFFYYSFVYVKAVAHPGSQLEMVAWILDRDRQTRLKARSLYLDGWPRGEAIVEAFEKHCSVLLDNRAASICPVWDPGSAGHIVCRPVGTRGKQRCSFT